MFSYGPILGNRMRESYKIGCGYRTCKISKQVDITDAHSDVQGMYSPASTQITINTIIGYAVWKGTMF